jgi:hypothetical protein
MTPMKCVPLLMTVLATSSGVCLAQPQTNTITSANFQYFTNGGASADPTVNLTVLSQDGGCCTITWPHSIFGLRTISWP